MKKKIILISLIVLILLLVVGFFIKKKISTNVFNSEDTKSSNIDNYVEIDIIDNTIEDETLEIKENNVVEKEDSKKTENTNTANKEEKVSANKSTTSDTKKNNTTTTTAKKETTTKQETTTTNNKADTNEEKAATTTPPSQNSSSTETKKEEVKDTPSVANPEPKDEYVRNDTMIAKMKQIIESNPSPDMLEFGFKVVVDSSITKDTNYFTFTEKRIISKIYYKCGTIKIYARDHYYNGEYIQTQCFML